MSDREGEKVECRLINLTIAKVTADKELRRRRLGVKFTSNTGLAVSSGAVGDR